MNRYDRHIILKEIGLEGQQKLLMARVLVVGAGGLGCPILQYLAAAGVGTIGIIDDDVIEISNLQRQVLFGQNDIGFPKAEIAKKKILNQNPAIEVISYPERLTRKNALSIFADYDIIVDGSDNYETRYLSNDASLILGKPLVYGSIYKFEGQLSVLNYQGGPSYRCLFPEQSAQALNCSEVGVLGILPGIIGNLMANEVFKIILKIGEVLNGQLLLYQSLTNNFKKIKFNRNERAVQQVLKSINQFEKTPVKHICNTSEQVKDIELMEAISLEDALFIDVRERHEQPRINKNTVHHIPLNSINEKINTSKTIITFCQSGKRSLEAAKKLKKLGNTNVFYLKAGAGTLKENLNLKIG